MTASVCLPAWRNPDDKHAALALFTLARPMLPEIPVGGRVLEIGCASGRWLAAAHAADPSLDLVGVDWRLGLRKAAVAAGPTLIEGDILAQPFAPASFDAIVSLSTIEHIGLGHYHSDPKAEDGDVRTVALMRSWLTPGGYAYFDVPYTPEGFFLLRGTKCRCYDDAALAQRFGPHRVLGYTNCGGEAWIDQPAANRADTARPYWYVALLIGG